jgi:hypothetical protein
MMHLPRLQIGFVVTAKSSGSGSGYWHEVLRSLPWLWPYIIYYLAYAAGMVWWITRALLGYYSTLSILLYISAAGWGALMCMCLWPPLETLLPRVETEEGWRIVWRGHGAGSQPGQQQQQEQHPRRQHQTGGTNIFASADDVEMAVAGYSPNEEQAALSVRMMCGFLCCDAAMTAVLVPYTHRLLLNHFMMRLCLPSS